MILAAGLSPPLSILAIVGLLAIASLVLRWSVRRTARAWPAAEAADTTDESSWTTLHGRRVRIRDGRQCGPFRVGWVCCTRGRRAKHG
ncbi:MAG: hypothetical protein U1D55_03160 [Phycisphaerae bacterium]